jgi:hypothetical protein
MPKTTPEQNKAIVLEAFDTLFNKRDYAAAEHFWSRKYIQHSAHIAPGREGLFALVRSTPYTLRYQNQLIVAEGDYVIAHGRFSGIGRPAYSPKTYSYQTGPVFPRSDLDRTGYPKLDKTRRDSIHAK